MSNSLVRNITVALVASAICSLIVLAQQPPQSYSVLLGPSYVLKQVVTIPQEGVSFDMNQYQSNRLGAMRADTRTATGWNSQMITVNTSTGEANLYYFYVLNGTLTCYAYPYGTLPYPFVTTPMLVNWQYIKEVVNPITSSENRELYKQYGSNVGRYVRRMMTNATSSHNNSSATSDEPLHFFVSNINAMEATLDAVLRNNTEPDPSLFDLPAVCVASLYEKKRRGAPLLQKTTPVATAMELLKLKPEVVTGFGVEGGDVETAFYGMIAEVRASMRARGYDLKPYSRTLRTLPAMVDHRAYVTSIRDQSFCGGCWAFSSAALAELVVAFKTNNTLTWGTTSWWLSVQNLLDCAAGAPYNATAMFPSKGCFGGWPLTALSYILMNGVMMESDYTYDAANGPCKFNGGMASNMISDTSYIPYQSVNFQQNIPLLMDAIVANGGVIAIMNADPILFYGGGFVISGPCKASLGHAVLLIGYGTDPISGLEYWLVKNSFGAHWGEAGFFRIQKGINLCGIEQMGFVAVAA